MTPIPKGMPCRRNCPGRYPGCYCELKIEWDNQQKEIKNQVDKKKAEDDAIYQIRRPNTVRRRER